MEKIKILLVDDHQMFSDGIKQLLEKEKRYEIVGQIFDGSHVLYNIASLTPDLILLDINLPKINGLDLSKLIIENYPKIKIIMLSMHDDKAIVSASKKIGVNGYIIKNSSSEKLIYDIDCVISGQNCFPQSLDNKVNGSFISDKNGLKKTFLLTDRELEILHFIKQGLSSKQISEKVNLSYLTIKTHRRNVHFKLKTETTAELIRFAMENDL